MNFRSIWRPALAAIVLAGTLTPGVARAFPESTETQGEIAADLNGVWLVVHQILFDQPKSEPSPGAPAVQVASSKRAFNVVNLFRMVHLKKDEAQKVRDAKEAHLKASIAKAEAIVAKDAGAKEAIQTADGAVEGGPRVIAPQIPRPPGYDPAAGQGDQVEIFLLDVPMPKTIDEAIQSAQKAEQPFEPTPEQLALLGSSWQSLTPKKDTEYNRIEWKVSAEKYYDQGMKLDPNMEGSTFAITGTQGMLPRPGQPDRNIVVYAVQKTDPKQLSGKHVRAMMATAPFPIPIEMKGNFIMYKVADLPEEKADTAQPAEPASTAEPAKDKTS
jgi:hypothetical protein